MSHVFCLFPPKGHNKIIGPMPTSKYKKLQQLRTTHRISSPRHNQIRAHASQEVKGHSAIPPIHQQTNQTPISVAKSDTTITSVAPSPLNYSSRTILNKKFISNLSNSSTSPTQIKSVNNDYQHLEIIGEGAFGVVYSAQTADGKFVAIKKVLQNPRYQNHEHDLLKIINNEYCVKMVNSFKSSTNKANESSDKNTNTNKEFYLNIVMNYMPQNLHEFNQSYKIQKDYPPIIMAKLFTYQIFLGLSYLHSPEINITHRDLKPRNILVDPDTGKLNICDFGSAKILSSKEPSVSYIASRYYRAPELIMNCTSYTNKIDIWACGCIFAEILTAGIPLFKGNTSMGQLYEIIKIIGQPSSNDLKSFQFNLSEQELLKIRSVKQKTTLDDLFPPQIPYEAIELLTEIFQYNPQKRPSAIQCLHHRCFDELFQKGVMLPNNRPIPPIKRPK